MTSRRDPRTSPPSSTTTVVRHARELADAGDRWFLSVAGGLGRLGDWALREADIAKDSAAVAFTTTVGVAKRLTGLESPRRRVHEDDAANDAARDAPERRSRETEEATLDLVSAVPASPGPARRARKARQRADASRESELRGHPAGVVPLLQALGRTVADHTQRGYATLEEDERFWTLIHLLQLLSRPIVPPRSNSVPHPACDAAADPSSRDPAEAPAAVPHRGSEPERTP